MSNVCSTTGAPSGTICAGGVCCAGTCSSTCSSVPATLASGENKPGAIAASGGFVYWTNTGDNSAWRVSVGGGAPQKIGAGPAASAMAGPSSIIVAAGNAYWTNASGTVMKTPIGGGAPTLVATASSITNLAEDAQNLYWFAGSGSSPSLMMLPIGGSQATPSSAPIEVMPDWLALGSTDFYFVQGSEIGGFPKNCNGCTPSSIISLDPTHPAEQVVVQDGTVYWTDNQQGSVLRIGEGQSYPTTMATSIATAQGPTVLAVDGVSAYFAAQNGFQYAIVRVPVGGGTATTITSSSAVVAAIAVDTNNVYWTDASGSVLKMPK